MGQDDMALTAFSRAVAHSERIESPLLIVTCLVNLAELYEVTGQLSLAEATCRRALAVARDKNGRPLPSAGQAYLGLAKVNRERNQLEQATENLNEALRLAELTAMSGLETDARMTQGLLERAKGNWPAANAALEKADKLTTLAGDPFATRRIGAFRSRINLARGNRHDPRLWAEVNGISADDSVDIFLEIEYLTLAHILLAEGQYAEAVALLDRWQPTAEAAGRQSRIIEYHILRAWADHQLDQAHERDAALKQALILAEPEGFIRIFADEGELMAAMLTDFLAGPRTTGDLESRLYANAREILDIIRKELKQAGELVDTDWQQIDALVEPLKERELQVLRLIAAGLSNREIGAELFLTEGTVKSYAHQLYGKLGVHRRTEAVEKARELKLIP
jgi:LuxR family maltose regulon positive regulatory protein